MKLPMKNTDKKTPLKFSIHSRIQRSLDSCRRWASVGILALAIAAPTIASADIYIEGSNSILGTLNPITGQITVIGPTSVRLAGLGFGPNGTLYGLGDDRNLYTVNTLTAGLTLIGATGLDFSNGYAMGATSDGTLYAQSTGIVYTVNPTTAAVTVVGGLGFTTSSDLNGDDSGDLYIIRNATSALYQVDRGTGATTFIGTGSYGSAFGLAFDNGTMFAMESSATGVYSLNLTNGASTLVSNYDSSVVGNIYTAAAVPEPSTFALLCLGAIAAIHRCRSRVSK